MNFFGYEEQLDDIIDWFKWYILAGLILFGFILRVLYLGYDSMWIDETISAVVASGILQYGFPILDSGAIYDRSFIFHYVMAFFMMLFGENDFGARFISVILGIFTIMLAYFLGRKLSNNNFVGLTFAFFITFSAIEIIYSQQARFYQGFQLFYFLSFFLFYKLFILRETIFNNQLLDFIVFGLSLFLAIHLQFMGIIMLPLFFLVLIITHFDQIHDFLNTRGFYLGLSVSVAIFGYMLYKLWNQFNYESLSQVFFYASLYTSYYFEYFPILIFAIIGLAVALIYDDTKLHLSFAIYALVPFFGLFFIDAFATRYVYYLLFFLFFYVAFLLSRLKGKFLITFILVLFFTPTVFSFEPIEQPRFDQSMPQADFKEAYEYVSKEYPQFPLVTTWAPAAVWYYEKPQYWIKYSVGGKSNEGWTTFDKGDIEIERFSGAHIARDFRDIEPYLFVLTLDAQAERKLSNDLKRQIYSSCEIKQEYFNIKVMKCKK